MTEKPSAPVVDIRSQRKKRPTTRDVLGAPPDDRWPLGTPSNIPEEYEGGWEDIARDAKKNPIPTPANIGLLVARSEDWEVAFDEFAQSAVIKAIPDIGAAKPRLGILDEYHVACAINWLAINHGVVCGEKAALKGLVFAAKQKWFDPVKDYLRELEWDGVPRLDTWLGEYVGVQDSGSLFLGRLWVISAVARALSPGCKADYMLVLIGGQGKRKTSVLEALCPTPEWFQPDLPDIRNKDSMQALTGVMIVNADEMNAFKRADVVELAKNFLTRSADRYRPPYGELFKTVHRRCVFAGTSNNKEVLNDPTGSRRFWCVEVGDIDLEALKADRDQLWAEAVSLYTDGHQWWPDRKGESLVSERNREQFTMVDPWAETIESLCAERDCVTMKEIFAELNFDNESKHGTAETRRITSVLTGMGWEQRGQKQIGKRRERTWKKKQ